MSNVKRWRPDDWGGVHMEEDSDGGWVLVDDYWRLKQRLAVLQAAIDSALSCMARAEGDLAERTLLDVASQQAKDEFWAELLSNSGVKNG